MSYPGFLSFFGLGLEDVLFQLSGFCCALDITHEGCQRRSVVPGPVPGLSGDLGGARTVPALAL